MLHSHDNQGYLSIRYKINLSGSSINEEGDEGTKNCDQYFGVLAWVEATVG